MPALQRMMSREPHIRTYAVMDAAVLDGLLEPLYRLGTDQFACLLAGHVDPDVAHVAPYLVAVPEDSVLHGWLNKRMTLPWGYLVESELPLFLLQRRLRRFGEARGPDGEELLFRFWDPRVMSAMITVLSPAQAEAFMEDLVRVRLLQHDHNVIRNITWDKSAARLSASTEPFDFDKDGV